MYIVCLHTSALTPLLSMLLKPDSCWQIYMWSVGGFPLWKSTQRAETTLGSNYLIIGDDCLVGPSCPRYIWQTVRCGSVAFGVSPRRDKTLIYNPRCLVEVSPYGKDCWRQPQGKIMSVAYKGVSTSYSGLSLAAPIGEGELLQLTLVWS